MLNLPSVLLTNSNHSIIIRMLCCSYTSSFDAKLFIPRHERRTLSSNYGCLFQSCFGLIPCWLFQVTPMTADSTPMTAEYLKQSTISAVMGVKPEYLKLGTGLCAGRWPACFRAQVAFFGISSVLATVVARFLPTCLFHNGSKLVGGCFGIVWRDAQTCLVTMRLQLGLFSIPIYCWLANSRSLVPASVSPRSTARGAWPCDLKRLVMNHDLLIWPHLMWNLYGQASLFFILLHSQHSSWLVWSQRGMNSTTCQRPFQQDRIFPSGWGKLNT